MLPTLLAVPLLAGCIGSLTGDPTAIFGGLPPDGPRLPGDPPDTPQPPDPPVELPIVTACGDAPTPGSAPLRRLSHEEFHNIVVDLFHDEALARAVTQDFISDPVSLGFRNSAHFLDVKPVMAQAYLKAAEALSARAVSAAVLPTLAPCHATGDLACATQLIDGFVSRLYRRPLTADERARFRTLFEQGRAGADFKTGVEWVLLAAFQSPHFLYRPEVEGPSTARALTPNELANRLSFLLWRSMPDEALLAAAATGHLETRADVEREARRMLTDEKAARLFEFFEQWLDIDELSSMTRNPAAFPGLSPTLAADLREEARQFVAHTVFEEEGSLERLFTSPSTWVNGALAQHYGLSGVTGAAFQRVEWPGARRGGLFMTSGSLVSHDKETRTSIVNRGVRVRTLLLCQTVPAPPDNVSLSLGPIDEQFTQGERLAAHRSNPSCAGCHTLIDPLGEAFEHLDAVGRERTLDEAGRPVVTAANVQGTRTVDGPVADGMEFMHRLASSRELQECTVKQLFRFGHGREEETADLCSRQRVLQHFKDSGWNVRELFVALTLTDDFLNKPEVLP